MAYVIINGGGLSGTRWSGRGLGGPMKLTIEHMAGLGGLGAVDRTTVIQQGISALVQANAHAKKLADGVVAASFVTTRGTNKEWAKTFTDQVEAMVVRLITPGHDGIYPFERKGGAKRIEDLAKFIETSAKEQAGSQQELLSISAVLKQASALVGQTTGEVVGAVVKEATKASPWVLPIAGLAVLAVAAYSWRAFR